jgi:type 1 glutamine amidotransferase
MRLPAAGEHSPGPGGEAPAYCPAVPAGGRPGPANFIEVKIARPEHAIARGLRGRFRTTDAPYRGLAVARGAEVIAVAVDDAARGTKEEPVLVASGYGKGRVFCSALGSDVAAMQDGEFLAALARGTEWTATGAAALPANAAPPRPGAGGMRGLVITGGHDHFTSFYTLFEGRKELAGMPVASAATAFQGDLRGKYDVLVLYDFTRELDDAGKRHLREFVESGGGVVVLHHALLDFQEWPWWYEDVVGGSYRLKGDSTGPSSTYKGGQRIFVTPAGEHPVTAGVGRFHVMDETYKRMRFSPKVRPLLTTDHPDSDRYLAWVGPCATSRVVAIQLGHGPTVFEHPSYRRLVHNAVLWAARRPE